MRRGLLLALLAGHAACAGASVIASGKHWSLAIGGIECEVAGARLSIAAGIRYMGPKGLVEAPLARLVDADGKPHPPKSLVWKSGDKALAPWLSRGGVAPLQVEAVGEVQLKFESLADGELKHEFGDIPAVWLSR